jgi:tungstate transport system permease protein
MSGSLTYLWEGASQALALLLSLDSYLLSCIRVQLEVSGSAVLLGTFIGIPAAGAIAFSTFRGKDLLRALLNTAMGLPPVGVGLVVFLLLTRRGPFGIFDLLYTPSAMILAQFLLVTPIIAGIALSALEAVPPGIQEAAYTLGARRREVAWVVLREARFGILTGILAGFGRAVAEVGAILTVGANIVHYVPTPLGVLQLSYTRTLTTAITVETRQGRIPEAIALGIVLFSLALLVNAAAVVLRRRFP